MHPVNSRSYDPISGFKIYNPPPIFAREPSPPSSAEHWLAVKSIQLPYFNEDVWQLILDNFKILNLPTSATSVPLVIKYIRDQNKPGYLDYIAKYFTRVSFEEFQGLHARDH